MTATSASSPTYSGSSEITLVGSEEDERCGKRPKLDDENEHMQPRESEYEHDEEFDIQSIQCDEDNRYDEPIEEYPEGEEAWDFTPLPRRVVNVEDLDLEKSYVKEFENSTKQAISKERPPRQVRWKHEGKEPLVDASKFPKGWNAREPDLDPTDIQGQIDRCKERIEDNIMPSFFKHRLKKYEAQKSQTIALQNSEPEGLSTPVLRRIEVLRNIMSSLKKKRGDPNDQLQNVKAILAEYREKRLQWTKRLVTYWSKGKKLCEPRRFDWDEFEAINAKHDGHQSFWVEGDLGAGPGPLSKQARLVVLCDLDYDQHHFDMAFRLPTREWWAEIPVLYDTGASMCGLYEDDLSVIAGPHRQDVPTLGMTTVRTGNKEIITRYVEMEATILSEKGGRLTPWIRITVGIDRLPRRRDAIRVCGLPIIRMLYCCSVPTPDFPLIMSDTRHQLHLPPAGYMADRRVYAESMVDPSTSPHPDIKLPEPTEHEVNSWKGDDWKNAPLRDTTWFN